MQVENEGYHQLQPFTAIWHVFCLLFQRGKQTNNKGEFVFLSLIPLFLGSPLFLPKQRKEQKIGLIDLIKNRKQ